MPTRLKDKYFFIFVRILMIHFLTSASLTINVILILFPVHAQATLYLIFMVCLHWVVVLQMIPGVIGGHFVWIAYLVIRHSLPDTGHSAKLQKHSANDTWQVI